MKPLDLSYHLEKRSDVQSVRVQLGTILVARVEHDPEYPSVPWGVSVLLPGYVPGALRYKELELAKTAAKAVVEDWLKRAHLR
jgi:hypothetical protein